MQLSKFLRVALSPCGKFYAVFNELSPEPLYLKNDYSSSDEITPTLLVSKFGDRARQNHLIIDSAEADEIFVEEVKRQVIEKISDPFILYLNLAAGCNFNCTYCPVPGLAEEHGNHILSSEQANQAISDWYKLRFQNGAQTNFIIFYGGEPLLNKPVFKTSLELLETVREQVGELKSLDLMMVTNGSLLDSEILSLCQKHNVTVVFGIDGVTVDQNRTRLRGQDSLSHFVVLANMRRAASLGLRVAASITLTPYNLDYLDEILSELANLGVKEIGFNFLKDASSISELNTREKLLDFWKRSAVLAYTTAKKHFPTIKEFQFQKKLMAWKEKAFFPLDCTCLGNQVVVQGDGYLSNCPFRHRDGITSDDLHSFLADEQGLLNEFRQNHPIWNPAYASLPEKALCGQGCNMGMKNSSQEGSQPEIDWSSYFYSQEAFYDFLWDAERNFERAAV